MEEVLPIWQSRRYPTNISQEGLSTPKTEGPSGAHAHSSSCLSGLSTQQLACSAAHHQPLVFFGAYRAGPIKTSYALLKPQHTSSQYRPWIYRPLITSKTRMTSPMEIGSASSETTMNLEDKNANGYKRSKGVDASHGHKFEWETTLLTYLRCEKLYRDFKEIGNSVGSKNLSGPFEDLRSARFFINATEGNTEILNFLLQYNETMLNTQTAMQETPQHQRDPSLLNKQNITGQTPLHLAIRENKVDAVKTLLSHTDCSVNAKDNRNETVLHYAASTGNVEVIRLLLLRGDILINLRNVDGETPLEQAIRKENAGVSDYLCTFIYESSLIKDGRENNSADLQDELKQFQVEELSDTTPSNISSPTSPLAPSPNIPNSISQQFETDEFSDPATSNISGSQLRTGVSFTSILNSIRDRFEVSNNVSRLHLLDMKDLHNIADAFGINKDEQAHSDHAVSVDNSMSMLDIRIMANFVRTRRAIGSLPNGTWKIFVVPNLSLEFCQVAGVSAPVAVLETANTVAANPSGADSSVAAGDTGGRKPTGIWSSIVVPGLPRSKPKREIQELMQFPTPADDEPTAEQVRVLAREKMVTCACRRKKAADSSAQTQRFAVSVLVLLVQVQMQTLPPPVNKN
ncbi:hypothetical protein B566_EDAN015493 [Ephemera danica]|nr:hypothetical protein B566_EDAN015493 [Ephemera danica]